LAVRTNNDEQDEALLAGITTGDRRAFEQLVSGHLDSIHSYLYRMTGSRADAEDLAQEAFFRVWRKAATYQPGRVKVSTWIHTIAHNLCVDMFRRHRESPTDGFPEQPDESTDPARVASDREQQRLLETAIQRLPDNQRSALLLCQVRGFSNAQAADILGINTRALESLLARARGALRSGLFANGEESE